MKTRQEIIAEYLLIKGYKEVPCKSRKYQQFSKTGISNSYFIGKAGAIRKGKTSSKSISISGLVSYKAIAKIVSAINPEIPPIIFRKG